MPDIAERTFEDATANVLAAGLREFVPGGYHRRSSSEYDKGLCLVPEETIEFILATQPSGLQARLPTHPNAGASPNFGLRKPTGLPLDSARGEGKAQRLPGGAPSASLRENGTGLVAGARLAYQH